MNKKKIVIPVIVVLLLIIIGIAGKLYYSWWLEERYLGHVPTNEFIIEEAENKKIIKHRGTKLTMEIPIDWEIEKQFNYLYFISPNFQLYPEEYNYYFPIFK